MTSRLGRFSTGWRYALAALSLASAVHVSVERREPLLPVAVDVARQRMARLLHGVEERGEERIRGVPALDDERPVASAILVDPLEAGLHPLEVRQAVRVGPAFEARVRRPLLEVERVPALEDHPVDRARPAEDLAARVRDAAPTHERLGLRLVAPVVALRADREGQGRRHVDVDVPQRVGTSRLEDEHAGRGIGAQAVREHAARGSAADDDVPILAHGGCRSCNSRCKGCSSPVDRLDEQGRDVGHAEIASRSDARRRRA